jgi:hypothetical protein
MGGVMLVHGGYSTEAALLLDDFCLFDVNLAKWINTVTKIDGVIFEKQNKYGRFTPDQQANIIGPRQMHCLVAVYDKAHYERKYKNSH